MPYDYTYCHKQLLYVTRCLILRTVCIQHCTKVPSKVVVYCMQICNKVRQYESTFVPSQKVRKQNISGNTSTCTVVVRRYESTRTESSTSYYVVLSKVLSYERKYLFLLSYLKVQRCTLYFRKQYESTFVLYLRAYNERKRR